VQGALCHPPCHVISYCTITCSTLRASTAISQLSKAHLLACAAAYNSSKAPSTADRSSTASLQCAASHLLLTHTDLGLSSGYSLPLANRFLPGGLSSLLWRDWTASPGIRFSSRPPMASAGSDSSSINNSAGSSPKYFVSLRKQPQVLRRQGLWDSWLIGTMPSHPTPFLLFVCIAGPHRTCTPCKSECLLFNPIRKL
jgi:hypothetical protein